MGSALVLIGLAGWSVFAFGGAYPWTMIPLFAGIGVLALRERPRPAQSPFRLLDAALMAALVAIGLQLVPLPGALRARISPAAVSFDRAIRLDTALSAGPGSARPLSLDPASTAWALASAAAFVVLFWSARGLFAHSGLRRMSRAAAWIGLIVAAFAIVQHATAPTLLYWYWRPISPGARPYGPFVNHNDFACWLDMAIPLACGYAMARIHSHGLRHGKIMASSVFDATAVWLIASLCLMIGALFVSLSRSGITAGAVALLALVSISRRQLDRQGRRWLLASLTVVVVLATAYTSAGALAGRVEDTLAGGIGGRRAIWRDTWQMIKDFRATGVGAGAYIRGMLVYQTEPRRYFYFNHAHDTYLQILAEGGLLLSVPLVVAAWAAAREMIRRLRTDRSAVFWLRAGAVSGVLAAAAQSVWDAGVLLPANAVMLVILVAIAIHPARGRSRTLQDCRIAGLTD